MSQDFRSPGFGLALAAASMAFASAGRAATDFARTARSLGRAMPDNHVHDHARANARRRRQIAGGTLQVTE